MQFKVYFPLLVICLGFAAATDHCCEEESGCDCLCCYAPGYPCVQDDYDFCARNQSTTTTVKTTVTFPTTERNVTMMPSTTEQDTTTDQPISTTEVAPTEITDASSSYPNASSTPAPPENSQGNDLGVILGAIFGSLSTLCAAITGALYYMRKVKRAVEEMREISSLAGEVYQMTTVGGSVYSGDSDVVFDAASIASSDVVFELRSIPSSTDLETQV